MQLHWVAMDTQLENVSNNTELHSEHIDYKNTIDQVARGLACVGDKLNEEIRRRRKPMGRIYGVVLVLHTAFRIFYEMVRRE